MIGWSLWIVERHGGGPDRESSAPLKNLLLTVLGTLLFMGLLNIQPL